MKTPRVPKVPRGGHDPARCLVCRANAKADRAQTMEGPRGGRGGRSSPKGWSAGRIHVEPSFPRTGGLADGRAPTGKHRHRGTAPESDYSGRHRTAYDARHRR